MGWCFKKKKKNGVLISLIKFANLISSQSLFFNLFQIL